MLCDTVISVEALGLRDGGFESRDEGGGLTVPPSPNVVERACVIQLVLNWFRA